MINHLTLMKNPRGGYRVKEYEGGFEAKSTAIAFSSPA
jgi:hypothetical protein